MLSENMIVYNILCKQKSQEKLEKKTQKKETPRCKIKLTTTHYERNLS